MVHSFTISAIRQIRCMRRHRHSHSVVRTRVESHNVENLPHFVVPGDPKPIKGRIGLRGQIRTTIQR